MGLTFTVDESGHLRVASTARRTIALTLLPEGACVSAAGHDPITLRWGDDDWSITHYLAGEFVTAGVAVRVRARGGHDHPCAGMYRATVPRWRRLNPWFDAAGGDGCVLPIAPAIVVGRRSHTAERETLEALARVLTERADLRPRLGEPDRATRLAADLASGSVRAPMEVEGLAGDTVDVVHALRQDGFHHPFGRPLAGERVAPLPDVVAAVRQRLERNPYREGRPVDDASIERVARRNYVDVEPWPFAALR